MLAHLKYVIKSLGIVLGDIGTSPIYTLSVIFTQIHPTLPNVLGVLSLIVWTLIMLVTVQYAWLAMSISHKGEGGTIVLKESLIPNLTTKQQVAIATFLSFIGISFFIGDGVITPAISILSAVEGLELIPAFMNIRQEIIIFISCMITIWLFSIQKKGTETVSSTFGPVMLVWFLCLGISGLSMVIKAPDILRAINPYYGIKFLLDYKFLGFIILSKVILCATGAEALYTDMGHLGRNPIRSAWGFAFVCLLFNYLGQGVFVLLNPDTKSIFYEMALFQFSHFYTIFLFLSIFATIIASQAMISGIFSIVYQGMTTQIMPKLHVEYTSRRLMSQIYIPSVNWFLLSLVLLLILHFKYSYFLASAYGLAASITMTITAILLTWQFWVKKDKIKLPISIVITFINVMFLIANTYKIPFGAYWSIFISMIPLIMIIIYTLGQRKLYKALGPQSLQDFVKEYKSLTSEVTKIEGTAVFLSKKISTIPTYIAHTIFTNNIIYEENIILRVTTQDSPFGISAKFKEDLAPGLRVFEIKMGYMEIMNLEKILYESGIDPKVIFYGIEEINTKYIIWKIFTLIKKLTPSFVQFYKLPADKLHGVIVRVEM
ncbi:KUP/HAK/KT family potassium transporter [Candidatus Dependentiae bacterium]|nr:KUP/HAK/KT family potassium transporter [Candidatus Dependentiae bacterium]